MVLLGVFGGQEVLLVVGALLLLFGGKKIPELMRGLGRGVSEFKKAKDGVYEEIEKTTKEEPKHETKIEKKD